MWLFPFPKDTHTHVKVNCILTPTESTQWGYQACLMASLLSVLLHSKTLDEHMANKLV